jgi:hypothetical protein
MHADRTNRAVLIALGLILLALGVSGLLLGAGIFDHDLAQRNLLDNPIGRFFGAQGSWLWPTAALGSLIVAALCLRWLYTIVFSTARLGDITVHGDRSAGRTTVASNAISEAVSEEIETYRGVHTARAQAEGSPADPRLAITINTDQNADLPSLRQRVETNALQHARQALDDPNLPIRLDITVTKQRSDRVV